MIIANNASFKLFVSDYNKQNSSLQTSMAKLASGQRMVGPGDAPADLGISERFRAQIRNSDEAGRVIQNGINMFSSSDSWLQQVQNMLDRMSELAISGSDGSKNAGDRENLNLEFQQLKQEISRISEAGKYNGLQVNGNTTVSTYDFTKNTIVYSQADGSDERDIGINLSEGGTAKNGAAYDFVGTGDTNGNIVGDYLFTDDGKNIVYINQDDRQHVMKLDLRSDMVSTTATLAAAGGTAFNSQMQLVMDEDERIWVSQAAGAGTATGTAGFTVGLLDANSMTIDNGGSGSTVWAGGVSTGSGFAEFAIHDDYMYYVRTDGTVYTDRTLGTAAAGTDRADLLFSLGKDVVQMGEFAISDSVGVIANTGYSLSVSETVTLSDITSSTSVDLTSLSIYKDATDAKSGIPSFDPGTTTSQIQVFKQTAGAGAYALLTGGGGNDYTSTASTLTLNAALNATDNLTIVFKGMSQSSEISLDAAPNAGAITIDYQRPNYQYVSQSLFDSSEVRVLVNDLDMENYADRVATDINRPVSTYTVSKDGLYLAWESNNGEITVMNTTTQEESVITTGSSANQNTINALEFDSNNNLYWTNTGGTDNQNTVNRVNVEFGDKPEFSEIDIIKNSMVGHLGTENYGTTATNLQQQGRGMSIMGGNPAANYTFQVGPDSGMDVEFSTANVEIVELGISRLDVLSIESSQHAIKALATALNTVSNERAVVGAQVSRMNFIHSANDAYKNNISQAESRLRDVDFASESAKLAKSQVMAQTSTAILAQANLSMQSVLRLLQ